MLIFLTDESVSLAAIGHLEQLMLITNNHLIGFGAVLVSTYHLDQTVWLDLAIQEIKAILVVGVELPKLIGKLVEAAVLKGELCDVILKFAYCITLLQLELALGVQVQTLVLLYFLVLFLKEVCESHHRLDHLRKLLLITLNQYAVIQIENVLANLIHFRILLCALDELDIVIDEILMLLLPGCGILNQVSFLKESYLLAVSFNLLIFNEFQVEILTICFGFLDVSLSYMQALLDFKIETLLEF